jgi:hypothetical protein
MGHRSLPPTLCPGPTPCMPCNIPVQPAMARTISSGGRAAKDRGALFHRGHAGQGDLVVLRAGAAAHPDCPDQLSGDDNGIAARRRDDAV